MYIENDSGRTSERTECASIKTPISEACVGKWPLLIIRIIVQKWMQENPDFYFSVELGRAYSKHSVVKDSKTIQLTEHFAVNENQEHQRK